MVKIELSEDGYIVIKELYSGVMMQTEEGHRLGICMRDDTFEINVMPKGSIRHCWQRVNMKTKNITRMSKEVEDNEDIRGKNDPC